VGTALRSAAGVAAVAAVALSVSGASALGQAADSRDRVAAERAEATAQAVAEVWRSADSSVLAAGQAPVAAPADVDALAAEVLDERDGGGASRSQDRTAGWAAGGTDPAAQELSGTPAAGSSDVPADDPVVQAQAQVRELVGQESADRADAEVAARAATTSAAQARADVEAARAQRAAEEVARALAAAQSDPRGTGAAMAADRGWGGSQFQCLDRLWTKESGWKWHADNPTSSAYGIPQSLPGEKMASAGADWATNPVTQIRWGLGYIRDRYGSACSAESFKQGNGWY